MPIDWKHTLIRIALGVLLAGTLGGAYVLGADKRNDLRCTEISIDIEDSAKLRFVTRNAVLDYLEKDYKGLEGMSADSIDLYKVESILNSRGAIKSSEAYMTNDGTLNISIIQRKPRMMFKGPDYSFYSTSDGFLLPLQPDFNEQLLTIEGNIPIGMSDCMNGRPEEPEKAEWLKRIVQLAGFINNNRVWNEKIGKIESTSSGELIILPKEGREKFLFGHPENILEKFEKIQIYYERITADKGDDRYNVVDLRFKDQIVCKDTETEKR